MTAMKMQFFTIASVIMIGIGLTGFEAVHWFLYLPVGLLVIAGVTGICPGLVFWRKIGLKDEANKLA